MALLARLALPMPCLTVLLLAGAQPVAAASSAHLVGGGTASISQVAFNVSIGESGAAAGSFDCLMAGRSAFVLPAFGLSHVMHVHATPDAGAIAGSVVRFSGPARLILDGNQLLDVHIQVWADTATQRFQLTVVEVGTMPIEAMASGQFSIRPTLDR